ncbi:rhodanese-like domain-containing protein [Blastopirellula retiformator]|nr:rhodanese-like domain-containing protein [Blastopirellula retiformator]
MLHLPALLVLLLAASANGAEPTTPSLAEVQKSLQEEKGILLDVRELREWEAGHLQAAQSLPLSELKGAEAEAKLKSLPKDKLIYTHCAVGYRAGVAAKLLAEQGYKVQPLKTSYQSLVEAGFAEAVKE